VSFFVCLCLVLVRLSLFPSLKSSSRLCLSLTEDSVHIRLSRSTHMFVLRRPLSIFTSILHFRYIAPHRLYSSVVSYALPHTLILLLSVLGAGCKWVLTSINGLHIGTQVG
jgi:hypothetical protein